MLEQEIDRSTEHFLSITKEGDYYLNERKVKMIAQNKYNVIVFAPGRSIYINSDEGTQYQPAHYIVLQKNSEAKNGIWCTELIRFPRSA